MDSKARIVIIMGVSGSGKTTIGKLLAKTLGWQFEDGDDFHSAANKAKMHSGHPLDDADRMPWLHNLAAHIDTWITEDKKTVLACSALKTSYRSILAGNHPEVAIVYLKADFETIAARLNARTGHFMNKDLLRSQFEALEEPQAAKRDADGEPGQLIQKAAEEPDIIIEVEADKPPKQVTQEIIDSLQYKDG